MDAAHSGRPPSELKAGALPAGSEEIELLREVIDRVSGRVAHLEEERDFYKELLEARPGRPNRNETPLILVITRHV
jgi:hypothetical protein